MNTSINDTSIDGEPRERGEARERNLTTADLAASANRPMTSPNDRPVTAAHTHAAQTKKEESALAPLFTEDAAAAFRSQWDVVQRGFVDDPQEAVRAGDELVGIAFMRFSPGSPVLESRVPNGTPSHSQPSSLVNVGHSSPRKVADPR